MVGLRVWAVSDLHTDYKENMRWCHELSTELYHKDVLIVAGDIADNLDVMRATFAALTARWAHVFFVPGNHDLWVRRSERQLYDSIGKLEAVVALCAEAGVNTAPAFVCGVWIVPLLAWYHATWDREPDLVGAVPVQKMMVDFDACRWPRAELNADDMSLAHYFDAMNDAPLAPLVAALQRVQGGSSAASDAAAGCSNGSSNTAARGQCTSISVADPSSGTSAACHSFGSGTAANGSRSANSHGRPPIITFSHFLPYQELLPEKRLLRQPNLAKAVGSDALAARIEVLQPNVHVFGHTHFSWDSELPHSGCPGTRFVQWPLAYPAERRERSSGGASWTPLLVWDGGPTPPTRPYWSRMYAAQPRDPHNVQPAPWCCVP